MPIQFREGDAMSTKLNITSSKAGVLCLLAALFAVGAQSATAQVLYGSLVGNVRDSSDAAIAGASVMITNPATNFTRQAITSDSGAYDFSSVPAGEYSIRISRPGFATYTGQQLLVTINSVSRVDVSLKVGEITESVNVSAEAAALQTDRSEVRSEISGKEMVNLPVPLGRNYQQLFRTLAGFAPPQNAHSIPTNPSRSLAFNVNGASRTQAMRQEFSDTSSRVRGQPLQDIAEVSVRVMPVELCRVHQAHDGCCPLARAQASREQPVVAPERDRPDLVFHPIVVNGQVSVVDVARQRCPSVQAVVDRLGRCRSVGHLVTLLHQPLMQRIGCWP